MNRPPARRALPLLLASVLAVISGCTDRVTMPLEEPPASLQPLARLSCMAKLMTREVQCAPDPAQAEGVALDPQVVGGQGLYVRLASSNVAYVSELFTFEVTVQNLMSLPLATPDGAARHSGGVKVFFVQQPEVLTGSGSIAIANATGTETFTASNQPYFQYGGTIASLEQGELGGDGILVSGEISAPRTWQMSVPATVESFEFLLLVAAETPPGSPASIAPQITSISPATLLPGATATITGVNFDAVAANNTVTIGGLEAVVTGGGETSLEVDVPCVASGLVPISVGASGVTGSTFSHSLLVPQRTVAVGEVLVVDDQASAGCNELMPSGGEARYVLSVFSNSTAPGSNAAFQISSDRDGGALPALNRSGLRDELTGPRLVRTLETARQESADELHLRVLEENRRILERHAPQQRQSAQTVYRDSEIVPPPATRRFRVANINQTGFCNNFYVVQATRVYYDGKIAIYEDDATPDAFKASLNATMAGYYAAIGDQINADMEPILAEYFGDLLRRDSETDNNGAVLALSTPVLNNHMPGTAGFVVSCDQFLNDDTSDPVAGGPYTGSAGSSLASSNHGEVIYISQPTVAEDGYSGSTPNNWYRTIRSTFIHELKHSASMTARVANLAMAFEESWLEEATARHAEELWARIAVDGIAWRSNQGYGSAAGPIGVYCDLRPSGFPECGGNPRRPASIMQRHFSSLHTFLSGTNGRLLSPFGPTDADNASYFYAISWSFVRYAADRYAADEAAFFRALNQATTTGVTNLAAVAGVDIVHLLGGWSIALAVDDHPLWSVAPSLDTQIRTWNFRSIYAGLNADIPATYTVAYPLLPGIRSFDGFTSADVATLRGGGALWYEVSGSHVDPLLLRLEANGGGTPPSTLRLAITRIQ